MIREFVARGGGLMLLGGHKAFDLGGIQNSLLGELLPVTFISGSAPALAGLGRPVALVKAAAHPTTEALDLSTGPLAFWWHRAQPKPAATTLLALANGEPAIVAGNFGKGRVLCVLLTCHGDPQAGQTAFWQWAPWPILLRDLCWWTSGREDARFE